MSNYRAVMCHHYRLPVIRFANWHPGAAYFRHDERFEGDYSEVLAVADWLDLQRKACIRAADVVLPAGWSLDW